MTTKHIYNLPLLTLLVSAGLLTACSSDDDNAVGGDLQSPAEAPRLITVEVGERSMTDVSAQAREVETRSVITTTSSLANFKMHGIFVGKKYVNKSYTVNKGNGIWTIDPNTWPGTTDEVGNSDVVSFYADTYSYSSPLTFIDKDDTGNPYVHFTIPENASTQHDLLVAKKEASFDSAPAPSNNSESKVGNVSLTFDHACAAIAFSVRMTNTLSDKLILNGKTLTVNSIVLKNVNNTGKYYFNAVNNHWQEVSGSAYYTLANSDITISTTAVPLSSNYLFLIPQTSNADGMYLEIKYTVSGNDESKTITIPLVKRESENEPERKLTLEAGKIYPIEIRLGTNEIEL